MFNSAMCFNISQVSNLKAGLLTWLDHLQRVLSIKEELDEKFIRVKETLKNIETFVETTTATTTPTMAADDRTTSAPSTTKQQLEECAVRFLKFFC